MKYFEFDEHGVCIVPQGDYFVQVRHALGKFIHDYIYKGELITLKKYFNELSSEFNENIKVPEYLEGMGWDLYHWPRIDIFAVSDPETHEVGVGIKPLDFTHIGELKMTDRPNYID